jgi:hypothetical protein
VARWQALTAGADPGIVNKNGPGERVPGPVVYYDIFSSSIRIASGKNRMIKKKNIAFPPLS